MSKKVNLAVAATVTLIAMAVTFSITMVVSQEMFNDTVQDVKNRERMYNKLSEIDRYVRNNAYGDINEDTLNDRIAAGYMLGIDDPYARYYSAAAYSEQVGVESGRLMNIGVSVVKDASSGYARILRVCRDRKHAVDASRAHREGDLVLFGHIDLVDLASGERGVQFAAEGVECDVIVGHLSSESGGARRSPRAFDEYIINYKFFNCNYIA